MGVWRIGTEELMSSHFAVSPLAETVGALSILQRQQRAPLHRLWYHRHIDAYRDQVHADPVTSELVVFLLRRRWTADFLCPPPHPSDTSIHDELDRVRHTKHDTALKDLISGLDAPALVKPTVSNSDIPTLTANLLDWTWTHTVRPYWSRRRHILEADIISRTQELGIGGWTAALNGLRPDLRWLGNGRLQINAHNTPDRDLTGRRLTFVPTTAAAGWVAWQEPERYALIYPAQGVLVDTQQARIHEPAAAPVPQALSRLLGTGRATILTLVTQPRSTTQLAALTGYSISSVSGHLATLLAAGFVERTRSGRNVLYFITKLGNASINATSVATPT